MSGRLTSVRLRTHLHHQLRLLAAALSQQQEARITMRSLLEEGVQALLAVPIPEWVQWAGKRVTSLVPQDEHDTRESESFRMDAELVRSLGVLAAQITLRGPVPVTKADLLEEAGYRIIAAKKTALQSSEGPS